MVSFSSVNGRPMHEHQELLTGVLKTELGFQGFVVSDWKAWSSCGEIRNADHLGHQCGDRHVMDRARILDSSTPGAARARADSVVAHRRCVRRILAVKCEFDLLDWRPRHTSWATKVGSAEHRELAREAVQRSLVLLKNDHRVLPLDRAIARLHVSGKNADDSETSAEGGRSPGRAEAEESPVDDHLGGSSRSRGRSVRITFSVDGTERRVERRHRRSWETPYAEMRGDVEVPALDAVDQALLETLHRTGVPVVMVILSGGLGAGPALDHADAIVAVGCLAPKAVAWPTSCSARSLPPASSDTVGEDSRADSDQRRGHAYDPLFPTDSA